jgi:hypothetical protein
MSGSRRLGWCLVLLVLALSNAGCLWVALGAAGGAAAVGYCYHQGQMTQYYHTSLDYTLPAVRAALHHLEFPIQKETVGEGRVTLTTRTRDGTKVRIQLAETTSQIPAEDKVTQVAVRVGTFGDELVSYRILEEVTRHLGQPIPNPTRLEPVAARPAGPARTPPPISGSNAQAGSIPGWNNPASRPGEIRPVTGLRETPSMGPPRSETPPPPLASSAGKPERETSEPPLPLAPPPR